MLTTLHPLAGLRSLRISRGVKAIFLAHTLGITEQSYYRLENGSRRIYLDKALALAKALNVTVEDLGRTDAFVDEPVELDHLPDHARVGTRTSRTPIVPITDAIGDPAGDLVVPDGWEVE